ncbi:MAG TPA: hypothetical protein V6C72_06805, partial [Chroococcales cyanobacterium]
MASADQISEPSKAVAQPPHSESLIDSLVNVPKDFIQSAAYSALQAPISGVAQIVDSVAGTNVLPHVQFISPVDTEHGNFLEKGSSIVGSAV